MRLSGAIDKLNAFQADLAVSEEFVTKAKKSKPRKGGKAVPGADNSAYKVGKEMKNFRAKGTTQGLSALGSRMLWLYELKQAQGQQHALVIEQGTFAPSDAPAKMDMVAFGVYPESCCEELVGLLKGPAEKEAKDPFG